MNEAMIAQFALLRDAEVSLRGGTRFGIEVPTPDEDDDEWLDGGHVELLALTDNVAGVEVSPSLALQRVVHEETCDPRGEADEYRELVETIWLQLRSAVVGLNADRVHFAVLTADRSFEYELDPSSGATRPVPPGPPGA